MDKLIAGAASLKNSYLGELFGGRGEPVPM
jgi:hypothetical protein